MARPKIEIDPAKVEYMASIFCSVEQMGQILGCSKDTLERRFAAIIKKGREKGKMSLMRKQFETAMKGNVTMLIWMGKQHLDQKDKPPDFIPPNEDSTIVYETQWGSNFEEVGTQKDS